MIQKLCELWCKWFGHKWDALDLVIFQIQNEAPNNIKVPEIGSRRCRVIVYSKDGMNRSIYG